MSTPPIDGGIVVVTGASSGIGAEFARQLAPRARVLVLVARRRERLDALAAELRVGRPALQVEVRPCDLSNAAAAGALADALLADHCAVDVLINNAGLGDVGLFHQRDEAKLLAMMAVNMTAPLVLTRRLLPAMVARRRGGVLNVSSGFGMFFMPGFGTYAATKHFLTAWTEALRLEVAHHGVVVSQLNPGPVATEFEDNAANPTGERIPALLMMSAQRCAKRGIRGFDRGGALIVPGLALRTFYGLCALAPRWLNRLALRLVARRFEV